MRATQKQVITAVQTIGNHLNVGESITPMIENIGLHSTVKSIVYRMFVAKINDYFIKDDDVYDAIQLIREYTLEMESGEVNFGDVYLDI